MKNYLSSIISDLEVWAECPTGPYERTEYQLGGYAFVALGILSSEDKSGFYPMTFHELLGIILRGGKNTAGINGAFEPGLIIMANKIIDIQGEAVKAQGMLMIQGENINPNGPMLTLEHTPKLGYNCWHDDRQEHYLVNLEHILSVMVFSSEFFDYFINGIEGFIVNIVGAGKEAETEVDELLDRIYHLKDKVNTFLTREVH